MTSVRPAGAKGTTIFTGLSGYPAADTGKTPSISADSATQILTGLALECIWLLLFFCHRSIARRRCQWDLHRIRPQAVFRWPTSFHFHQREINVSAKDHPSGHPRGRGEVQELGQVGSE